MIETIRSLVKRLFPELFAGYHLPKFAVVESISDAPVNSGICDRFRPRYAVNLRILDEHLEIVQEQALLEAVPVSMPTAGMEKGLAALPEVGCIVEIAFAYGKPSLPFVRTVLPTRQSLPSSSEGSQRWQSQNSHIQIDGNGDLSRKTQGEINDTCNNYIKECAESIEFTGRSGRYRRLARSSLLAMMRSL